MVHIQLIYSGEIPVSFCEIMSFDDIHFFCSFHLLRVSIEQQPYSNILPALQLPYILTGRNTQAQDMCYYIESFPGLRCRISQIEKYD